MPTQVSFPDMNDVVAHADEAAILLKSLAHPCRLLVMCRLVEGEASVSELHMAGNLSMSALSQHLGVMREAGLVKTRRQSQAIYYSLVDGPAVGVLQSLHAAYCKPSKRQPKQDR